jgi:hypothetical protein
VRGRVINAPNHKFSTPESNTSDRWGVGLGVAPLPCPSFQIIGGGSSQAGTFLPHASASRINQPANLLHGI